MPPPPEAPDADFEVEEDEPEEAEPWIPSDPESEPWAPSDSEPEPDQSALEEPSPATPEPEQHQQPLTPPLPLPHKGAETSPEERRGEDATQRWPGWPGASVFRLVVPGEKVGGLIGRRGETIRRVCDETRARVRVLDAAHGAAHRIVLVSATEEVEAEIPPAVNAAIKIFKKINEIGGIDSDGTSSAAALKACSVKLLVPFAQAIHLIGKQGSTIKLFEDSTGATIRIVDADEVLGCERVDERIVDIHGASLKVHNALRSVLGLLRKFLVDHGVLHLFERKIYTVTQPQDTCNENQVIGDYPHPMNKQFLFSDERSHCNKEGNNRLVYGRDLSFSDSYTSHATDSIITQVTQTMQIPLPCAEDIIGMRGQNIEFIRSVSGAVMVLEECGHYPSEVLVMITGNPSQVQMANQHVQEILSGYREPPPWSNSHSVDACPMFLNSPHDTRAAQDLLPPFPEDQLSRNHRGHSSRLGFGGYWL